MSFDEAIQAAITRVFADSTAYDTWLRRASVTKLDLHLTVYFPEKSPVEVWLPACDTLVEAVRQVWAATPPVKAMHRQHIDELGRVTIALTAVDDE